MRIFFAAGIVSVLLLGLWACGSGEEESVNYSISLAPSLSSVGSSNPKISTAYSTTDLTCSASVSVQVSGPGLAPVVTTTTIDFIDVNVDHNKYSQISEVTAATGNVTHLGLVKINYPAGPSRVIEVTGMLYIDTNTNNSNESASCGNNSNAETYLIYGRSEPFNLDGDTTQTIQIRLLSRPVTASAYWPPKGWFVSGSPPALSQTTHKLLGIGFSSAPCTRGAAAVGSAIKSAQITDSSTGQVIRVWTSEPYIGSTYPGSAILSGSAFYLGHLFPNRNYSMALICDPGSTSYTTTFSTPGPYNTGDGSTVSKSPVWISGGSVTMMAEPEEEFPGWTIIPPSDR